MAADLQRRAWVLAALSGPVVLLGGCAWLSDKEHQLALRPSPGRPANLPPDDQLFQATDRRWLAPQVAESGQAHQQVALWWLPQADAAAPALLYLHGSFRNLYHNLPKINALRALGFSILAVDYRGWGDSTRIVPDETSIAADAALAWKQLLTLQPRAQRRVIYGHSMGGAVAVRLASELPAGAVGAVVLESTFTSMPDVAASAGWFGRVVSKFTALDFDSASRIKRVQAPLVVIHGTADTTVPINLGRRLRDAAAPQARLRWVEVPGGSHSRLHSDAPELYNEAFLSLMKQLLSSSL